MKVKQFISESSSNPVANQFILSDDEGNTFFQSYESIIVKQTKEGKIYLDERYWNYSVTTSKYRNQFLGEQTKETQKKINSGDYILTNLN